MDKTVVARQMARVGEPVAAPASAPDLRTYLGADRFTGPTIDSSGLATQLRQLLGPWARHALKVAGTRLVAPWSARQLRRAHGSGRPLLLNLGSGTYNAPGWINIDLWGMHSAWGVDPDVLWDLRKPLPLPDGSVSGVFMEHVLEHLPAPVGLAAIDECARLLAPGGVLRISVPDFGRYARSYAAGSGLAADDADFLVRQRPDRPTTLLALAEVVYDHGHVSIWDAQTLTELLRCAGLTAVAESAYGRTRLFPVPDNPDRQGESLYVEGVAPQHS